MCMNLSLWLHLRMHQSEGRYSPVQIIAVPTALAQGQFLTKSRLVDLNDPDAVAFEVEHFVADGQCDLKSLLLERDILTWERPVEDGDRPRQHTLDGLVGTTLGEDRPVDRHRRTPTDIAPDDGRLDASGTITLYPGILRKHIPVHLRTEVLHHVVALKLPMHQHVEPDALLQFDALQYLVSVEVYILFA